MTKSSPRAQPGWYVVHGGGWRRQAARRPHHFAGIISSPDSFGHALKVSASPSACRAVKVMHILDFEGANQPADACKACVRGLAKAS